MLLLESAMVNGGPGRPRKKPDEPANRQVRVFSDLADMIGWIWFFKQQEDDDKPSVAQILDPLLRKQIAKMYEPYESLVKDIQARKAAKKSPEPKRPDRKQE